MHPLEEKVKAFRTAHPGSWLVAVSGGRDSSTLLEVCRGLVPAGDLAVAHFNHRTRGEASDADEAFVRDRAQGLRLFVGHAGRALRSEEEMRAARWEFLRGLGDFRIVTAHHLNDQLETFLMRLLRGAGLEGLGAMAPSEHGILRPFLDVTAAEIAAYGAPYREDASNADERFFRNRVRARLVPRLAELADEKWLARFGKTLGELRGAAAELRPALDTDVTPYWTRLRAETWDALSDAARARGAREILRDLHVRAPDRATLEEAIARGKGDLAGGVAITRSCGHVYFQTAAQRAARPSIADLFSIETRGEMRGLEARFFQPGDRFGRHKLKRLLLERRIPKPERAFLPVLAHPGTSRVEWFFSLENPLVTVVARSRPFSL